MKDTTYEKLFELSFKTKERLVTPLMLDYYRFESLGISETGIVKLIENKLNPLLS
jgi:hypothetical protein